MPLNDYQTTFGFELMPLYTMRKFGFFCFSFLLLCSCIDRRRISAELDRAEALIKEDPAYAQNVLDSLHTAEESQFAEPDFQARYILLNEYAKYRNGIDEKDDSLISIAEEYYMQHGTDHDRMLCLFLHGRTLFSSQEYGSAMLKYAYAAEYAKTCSDHFMLGQIYTNQYLLCADVFGTNAIELAQDAQKEYSMAGDSIYIMDSKTNLGIAYYCNRQYKESEVCLQSALQSARLQNDTFAIKKCIRFLAYLNNEKGEAAVADSLFHVLFNLYHDVRFLQDYAIMSEVYAQQHQFESALHSLSRAMTDHNTLVENRMQYLRSATRVFAKMSDYESAFQCSQEYQLVSDSVFWGNLNNSVMKEQRDFVQDKLTRTEHKNYYMFLLICCLSLVLSVISLLLYNVRIKQKREKECRQYIEKELELKELNAKNSLKGIKTSAVVDRIKDRLKSNNMVTPKEWKDLKFLFDDMLPNFGKQLKVFNLREEELKMCMLQKLDFMAKDIDFLVNIPSSVTSHRLAKKCLGSKAGANEWKEFLQKL